MVFVKLIVQYLRIYTRLRPERKEKKAAHCTRNAHTSIIEREKQPSNKK